MINPELLMQYSKQKYLSITEKKYTFNKKLFALLDNMKIAFQSPIELKKISPISITTLKSIFINFNKSFNGIKSKFLDDVNNLLNYSISFKLIVPGGTITLNFLYTDHQNNLIALIIHAINTFCYLFKNHNYNGLVINICLDNNFRTINCPDSDSYDDKLDYLKKNSLALNVSGVTYKYKKIINITRIEEIIKLLFHELVHYIELDDALTGISYTKNWSISSNLNLSETYTEFISVLCNSAYQTIYLCKNESIYDLYSHILQKEIAYSIYLTSNILKFYDYNIDTYKSFFTKNQKHDEPIPLWEYIFLRTMLMININTVIDTIPTNLVLVNTKPFINLLNNDNDLINYLSTYMQLPIHISVSYNIIDLDWSKI